LFASSGGTATLASDETKKLAKGGQESFSLKRSKTKMMQYKETLELPHPWLLCSPHVRQILTVPVM
jgi:hypothetical protein